MFILGTGFVGHMRNISSQTLAKDYNKFPFLFTQCAPAIQWRCLEYIFATQTKPKDEKMMSLLYPSRIVTEDKEERFGDDGSRCIVEFLQ
jgi:hypothetical protein